MPMATPALQHADPNAQTVSRRNQTSVPEEQYVSFVRESRKATQFAFSSPGNAFGGLVAHTLKPSPGYLRRLILVITASGGTGVAAVYQPDAPWSAIQSFQLKDAFGTVVYQCDGYGMFLIQLYSGQFGSAGGQDPTKDAFYVAPATNGNFTFALCVPLEFDPDTGYSSLPSMNAAAQMSFSLQLGTQLQVYSTNPTTVPTLKVDIYQEFWAVPISDPTLTPPDDGSSHQWTYSQGGVTIVSTSNSRVNLPDVGTYISALILLFRDSTNARTDQPFTNSDVELWIDGVPVLIEHPNILISRMFRQFLVTRPTGVLVYTFRNSTGFQVDDDNMEQLLVTTPGTLVEIFSGAWGTITNSPATVFTYTGKLYPVGDIPEHHFA